MEYVGALCQHDLRLLGGRCGRYVTEHISRRQLCVQDPFPRLHLDPPLVAHEDESDLLADAVWPSTSSCPAEHLKGVSIPASP